VRTSCRGIGDGTDCAGATDGRFLHEPGCILGCVPEDKTAAVAKGQNLASGGWTGRVRIVAGVVLLYLAQLGLAGPNFVFGVIFYALLGFAGLCFLVAGHAAAVQGNARRTIALAGFAWIGLGLWLLFAGQGPVQVGQGNLVAIAFAAVPLAVGVFALARAATGRSILARHAR
jgi:hypothetical protein